MKSEKTTMVICIGEILLDVYGEEKGHSLELTSKLGGAPFNVAANIALQGGSSSFYGVLGNDPFGDFAAKEASFYPLKGLILDRTSKANTTLAMVTVKNGERSFRFLRSPGADYLFDETKLPLLGIKSGDIVHFGSLMLSKGEGRAFMKKAIAYVHDAGAFVSFDANLRLDVFQDEEEARSFYEEVFPCLDILKLSEDELAFFFAQDDPEAFKRQKMKGRSLLFASYGEKGSACYALSSSAFMPSSPLKPVDTTGAGDAFYARVLSELDKASDPFALSALEYQNILSLANEEGAKAVSHLGALPVLPF